MADTTPILPLALAALAAGTLSSAALLSYSVFSPRCQFWASVVRGIPQRDGVALTFDDGPDPEVTPRILDILATHGVQATFFMIGRKVEKHPEVAARVHQAGHTIGNHSLDHDHFGINRSVDYWRKQVGETQRLITEATGQRPLLFRPPMGFKTRSLARAVREERLPIIGWSQRGYDTRPGTPDALVRKLLKRTSGHDIVLLHDGVDAQRRDAASATQRHTAEALPAYLEGLAAKDLRVLPLLEALLPAGGVQSQP